MHVVIIGSSGGIGAALTEAFAAESDVTTVSAFARSDQSPATPIIQRGYIDIEDESSIEAAATLVMERGAPTHVLVATGVLSAPPDVQPEKTYRQQSLVAFERVFAINTFGPALIAKHFLPLMPRKGRAVLAALSARVGSISDNRLGGWHAYRASKAALNMLIKTYALETASPKSGFYRRRIAPRHRRYCAFSPVSNKCTGKTAVQSEPLCRAVDPGHSRFDRRG